MLMKTRHVLAVTASLAALAACGSEDGPTTTSAQEESVVTDGAAPEADPADDAAPSPPDGGGNGNPDADAYARVVMTTNLNEVFSGYEIDGATVRFTVKDGADLDDAQCQYLRLSNSALREAAGLAVVVVDDGAEVEC